MKKSLMLFCFLFASFASNAITPAVELDEKELQNEFKELDKIEEFIQNNEGITLSELQNNHSNILKGVSLQSESNSTLMVDQLPLASGFWWGCCLGPVGLALVYFITDNNREEVKNALIGCIITTLIGGGLFGIFGNPFN